MITEATLTIKQVKVAHMTLVNVIKIYEIFPSGIRTIQNIPAEKLVRTNHFRTRQTNWMPPGSTKMAQSFPAISDQIMKTENNHCLFCRNGDLISLSPKVTSGMVAWKDVTSDWHGPGSFLEKLLYPKKCGNIVGKYRKVANPKKKEIHVGNLGKYKKLANPSGSLGAKKGVQKEGKI